MRPWTVIAATPRCVRAVEDLEKLVAALGRVVDAAAHLDRDGNVRRHGVAHAADDLQRHVGLAQVKAAAAAAEHFLHRAAEVDVDHVEAALDQPQRGRAELLGLGAHELPADGMLFVGDVQEVAVAAAAASRSTMNWSSITSHSV